MNKIRFTFVNRFVIFLYSIVYLTWALIGAFVMLGKGVDPNSFKVIANFLFLFVFMFGILILYVSKYDEWYGRFLIGTDRENLSFGKILLIECLRNLTIAFTGPVLLCWYTFKYSVIIITDIIISGFELVKRK